MAEYLGKFNFNNLRNKINFWFKNKELRKLEESRNEINEE
jgi:hypothetical protein